ncbi:hypothetical protein E2320_009400 [Naja naja]|nr:hypothetical protein E2320_009400 [Naja naja]
MHREASAAERPRDEILLALGVQLQENLSSLGSSTLLQKPERVPHPLQTQSLFDLGENSTTN